MNPHPLHFAKERDTFRACTPFGDYTTFRVRNFPEWHVRYRGARFDTGPAHKTLELAQRACRIDYVARFREAFGFDQRHDAAAVIARAISHMESQPPAQQWGDVKWADVARQLRDVVCVMETKAAEEGPPVRQRPIAPQQYALARCEDGHLGLILSEEPERMVPLIPPGPAYMAWRGIHLEKKGAIRPGMPWSSANPEVHDLLFARA